MEMDISHWLMLYLLLEFGRIKRVSCGQLEKLYIESIK
tara:strand:- start:1160 stop:1273 length:114 start_codon:yes stop_codon:yes gene_type:complete